MTDPKTREYYNLEAIRGLVGFCAMLLMFAICLDVGALQAMKQEMDTGISLAAMTAVEAMPDTNRAVTLAMNVANSQGLELHSWEITTDPDHRWIEIDKSGEYDTMFLKYVGIDRIPIIVHAYDFKPGI